MTSTPANPPPDAAQVLRDATYAVPGARPGNVVRPRLRERLDGAADVSLVLVSAPAGTGKTTLVAEWARAQLESGLTCGWTNLADGTESFWADVVECLQRSGVPVPPEVVRGARTRLLGRRLLGALAEAVLAPDGAVTVVLDGLELDRLDLAREVDFLLRHTSGHLRLVVVTRVDPVLPLSRYRLADMLAELRVADLAFTDEEAADLLASAEVELPGSLVHELNERVSGWAAGLRFASRALGAVPDSSDLLATVLGRDHDITEYLVGEVLNAQGAAAREVMLAVSVPDLVLPGLAEELAGPAASRILADLTRGRAFVEQVHDQPGCYRFYPFFRELLRTQLAYEQPAAFTRHHLTCADWFAERGLLRQALEHLVSARAWHEVAAFLVGRGLVGELLAEGTEGRLAQLGGRIPVDLEEDDAAVVRAAVAVANGEPELCAAELARIGATGSDRARVAVARSAAVVDAIRSVFADDVATALVTTRRADDLLRTTGTDEPDAADLAALLSFAHGVASLREGDAGAATRALEHAAASTTATRYPQLMAMTHAYLALAEIERGDNRRARTEAMHSLTATIRMGQPTAHSHAVALTVLARVKLEQDPAAAHRLLQPALESRALRHDPLAGGVARSVTASIEHPAAAVAAGAGRRRPAVHDTARWDEDLPDIVEDLTPKELEVLGHLAELLTTEEIAEKMFVSVNTVRTHIRSILRKLGVNRRNAAIRKARQLHLLPV